MNPYHAALSHVISRRYHCESAHLATRNVCRYFDAYGMWEGDIELFAVIGHPKAKLCYAWGERRHGDWCAITVLRSEEVRSAAAAVACSLRQAGWLVRPAIPESADE
jgi:hypothetical protein